MAFCMKNCHFRLYFKKLLKLVGMLRSFIFILFSSLTFLASAQQFEIGVTAETYKGYVGDQILVPLFVKNTSTRTLTLVLKRTDNQIGGTQRNILCPDGQCQEFSGEEFIIRLEPGQSVANLSLGIDAGLVPGNSRVRYTIFNKSNPNDAFDLDLFFSVEEKPAKTSIFSSRQITMHEIYPNPVSDVAFIDYRLANNQAKAKIIIHNILGSALSEYDLTSQDTRVKIRVDEMAAGVYFYTLYLDNESVMTRKLVVKR
jgi:hypothetical protein